MTGDPRKTRQWQALHRALIQPGAVCWLCGRPILFGMPRHHRLGPSLDHVHPLVTHPHLALDPSNLRPAHTGCNASKGARPPTPTATPARRRDDW